MSWGFWNDARPAQACKGADHRVGRGGQLAASSSRMSAERLPGEDQLGDVPQFDVGAHGHLTEYIPRLSWGQTSDRNDADRLIDHSVRIHGVLKLGNPGLQLLDFI